MKKLLHIALVLFVSKTMAQDFHVANYDMATQYLNPALSGMYMGEKGDYRIYSDYRAQWRALGIKPYTSAFFAYDIPYKKWDKDFGLGTYILNTRSGIGKFNTFSFMLSGSYNITQKSEGKHFLLVGIQMGLFNKNFDPNSFTYDVQYSPSQGTFDTNIPNEEYFPKTSIFKFDANAGVFYKYGERDKKVHPFGGFAFSHVNRANESFTSYTSRLPLRFTLHAGCDVTINEKIRVTPLLRYVTEARAYEYDAGFVGYYKVTDISDVLLNFTYRYKDAVVIGVGIKQNQHIFRFSYDINTSYLNNYTGGRGAWEIALILTGIKGQQLFSPRF